MNVINQICYEKANVYIQNKNEVEKKIEGLIKGGKNALQVISDFDNTLSMYSYNGERCPSSHGILESSPFILPPESIEKLHNLKNHYYPLEISHDLTIKEKIPLMVEWWEANHETMLKSKFTEADIEKAVSKSNAMLRHGHETFFKQLNDHNVPLLIFSAGIGNVLAEVIRQKSIMYPNTHVVANYMKFDQQGWMCGFEGQLIHTFNKNEGALHNCQYFSRIDERKNVLLMGDSLGDLRMADGISNLEICLKVGFLNSKIDELLETYKQEYDIVIIDEPSLDVANMLISSVFQQ